MNQFVSKWLFSTNHKDIHSYKFVRRFRDLYEEVGCCKLVFDLFPLFFYLFYYLFGCWYIFGLTPLELESRLLLVQYRLSLFFYFFCLGLIVFVLFYRWLVAFLENVGGLRIPNSQSGYDILIFIFFEDIHFYLCKKCIALVNKNKMYLKIFYGVNVVLFIIIPFLSLFLLALFIFEFVSPRYILYSFPLLALTWSCRLFINSFIDFTKRGLAELDELIDVTTPDFLRDKNYKGGFIEEIEVSLTKRAQEKGFNKQDLSLLGQDWVVLISIRDLHYKFLETWKKSPFFLFNGFFILSFFVFLFSNPING